MRMHALTAAAVALLATGCGGSSQMPLGDVDVFWDFVRFAPAHAGGVRVYDSSLAAANVNGVCPESGVDSVRVTSALGSIDVACTGPVGGGVYSQGLTLRDLDVGPNNITVTGFRGSTAVYRSTVTVQVLANQATQRVVDVAGIQREIDLLGDLLSGVPGTPYANCAAANFPDISFDVHDSFGTLVLSGLVGCGTSLPSTLYAQALDVDNYTVRAKGLVTGTSSVVLDSCSVPFDHFVDQLVSSSNPVTVDLFTNPVPTCL